MTSLEDFFAAATPGRLVIAGAPEGHDAFVLGGLPARAVVPTLLHVCRDDGRMARMRAALAFFHPGVEVLTLPAWDCLPYDRVSPNAEIVSRRIGTLTRLAGAGASAPAIVLTTVNAIVQRMPPRAIFADRVLRLGVGGRLPLDRLVSFLGSNGYLRTDTVREPGDFALRGGIVDLFPAGAAAPVRLDFFGDTLETIRLFDPLTQRSNETCQNVVLRPVSEVLLDERAIQRFRSRYREQFGTVADDDALYEAVSAGQRYIGMEHWLPLYYETLETVFDYLPGAAVTLDPQAEEVRADRLAAIADFYAARRGVGRMAQGGGPVYRPIEPAQLYLDEAEWQGALAKRRVGELTPFAAPADQPLVFDAGARAGVDFAAARTNPQVNLFDAVRDHIGAEAQAGHRVMLAAYSAGSAERLKALLQDHGVAEAAAVESWEGFATLPPRSVGFAVLGIERGYGFGDTLLVTEQDILGDRLARPPRRRTNYKEFVAEVAAL